MADSWQAAKPHKETTVRIATLDKLLEERELRAPIIIKIDVEDNEAAVLRGARGMIGRYRPAIVCEILPRAHNNKATVEALADLNYSAFAITVDGCFRFGADDFRLPRQFTDFLLLPSETLDPSVMFIPARSEQA